MSLLKEKKTQVSRLKINFTEFFKCLSKNNAWCWLEFFFIKLYERDKLESKTPTLKMDHLVDKIILGQSYCKEKFLHIQQQLPHPTFIEKLSVLYIHNY